MTLARLVLFGLMTVSCAAPMTNHRQAVAGSTEGSEAVPKSSIGVVLGNREFGDDFEPVEDQPVFGVEAVIAQNDGIPIEFGFSRSSEEEEVFVTGFGVFDFEIEASEFYLGIRTPAASSRIRPYLAGGLTLIDVEATLSDATSEASVSDDALGLYLHAGVQATITDNVWIGFDVRSVFGADLTIAGLESEADYLQVAATLGFWF